MVKNQIHQSSTSQSIKISQKVARKERRKVKRKERMAKTREGRKRKVKEMARQLEKSMKSPSTIHLTRCFTICLIFLYNM